MARSWSANDPSGKPVAGRTAYLILHNTSEVVTPDAEGREILRFPKGAVVFRDGRVLEVGPGAELSRRHPDARPLNAGGKLVTPGLVDCHTHMIFGGHRAVEFQRKLAGESYARDRGVGRRHPVHRATRTVGGEGRDPGEDARQPARTLARERLHDRRGEERLRADAAARDAPARAHVRRGDPRARARAPHGAAAARAARRVSQAGARRTSRRCARRC